MIFMIFFNHFCETINAMIVEAHIHVNIIISVSPYDKYQSSNPVEARSDHQVTRNNTNLVVD